MTKKNSVGFQTEHQANAEMLTKFSMSFMPYGNIALVLTGVKLGKEWNW